MNRSLHFSALLLAALAACGEDLTCRDDQIACGDACTNVATDPANCGACGRACGPGQSCLAGSCFCPWETTCDEACVDFASDPGHCGTCDNACAGSLLCTTDDEGQTACAASCAGTGQTACGRACVDLRTHRQNCGACGRSCGTNERCDAGRCLADLYLACFNSDDVRLATTSLQPAGLPLAIAPGPVGFAWIGDALFVASARPGGVETLSAVRFDLPGTRVSRVLETSVTTPDIQYLAAHDGLLYIAHASVGSLLVATPDGRRVDEMRLAPVGDPNPNPVGMAFHGDKAYVALNESGEVVVLDVSGAAACARGERSPPCLSESARIDVQPLASEGALARPSRVAIAGGRAYVTLWNLDAFFAPPADSSGRLAVIDTATDALDPDVADQGVTGLLDLGPTCLNPAGAAVLGTTLYVSCGAFVFDASWNAVIAGSGIVQIELSGEAPVLGELVAMEDDEAPGTLAFCGGAGYVADRNSGRVFPFDPVLGTVGTGVALCPESNGFAYVSDIACGP